MEIVNEGTLFFFPKKQIILRGLHTLRKPFFLKIVKFINVMVKFMVSKEFFVIFGGLLNGYKALLN